MKCPNCQSPMALSSYEPVYCFESKEHTLKDVGIPLLDPLFQCTLTCFDCLHEQNVSAEIVYPNTEPISKVLEVLKGRDSNKYDGTEVHPCIAFDHESIPLTWKNISQSVNFEPTDENDNHIACWSVYLHLKVGGMDSIKDFETKKQAKEFEQIVLTNFFREKNKPEKINTVDKGQILKEKLEVLNKAFQDLDNYTQYATGLDDSFNQDYPFDATFDEMAKDVKQWVKSASTHCLKNDLDIYPLNVENTVNKAEIKKVQRNQSINLEKLLAIDWNKYDSVWIHGSTAFDKENKPLPWEQIDIADSLCVIEKGNDYISSYSVFISSTEGLESIGEFKECAEAERFVQLIKDKFLKCAPDQPKEEKITTSVNQSVNFAHLSGIDWALYTSIAIEPCLSSDENEKPLTWDQQDKEKYSRPSEPQDKFATYYQVYVSSNHSNDTVRDLGKFEKEKEAEQFKEFISNAFLKHLSKTVALSLDCTVGRNVNTDALVENVTAAIKNSDNCQAIIKDFDINSIE